MRYSCAPMAKSPANIAQNIGDEAFSFGPTPNHGSLHGQIVDRLRDFFVEGNVKEGGRVPEKDLCQWLGISRTPLREALKVLAAEGLLELLPNRGSRVRKLSREEVTELFDVMGGLEALGGRLACEIVSDEEIAEVEKLHHDMYSCYLRRDLHGYFLSNQLIHEKIVLAARNNALLATYKAMTSRLRRARFSANTLRSRDRWSEAMREHEDILDAFRRRSGQELGEILFQHLRNKRNALCLQVEE